MAAALLTAQLLFRQFGRPAQTLRFATLDGFRGVLVLGVFLCHASMWYFFCRMGRWDAPPSHFYSHLGQSSVAFFFMITGFLFFNKLLDAQKRPVDWLRLYVSRVMRLVPLYAATITAMFFVAFAATGFTRHTSWPQLFKQGMIWLSFSAAGKPDVNGLLNTQAITAGVTWSLPYEWLFYLLLPVMALSLRAAPKQKWLLLSTGFAALMAWRINPDPVNMSMFLGGIAAAYAARNANLTLLLRRRWVTLAMLALALGMLLRYPQAKSVGPVIICSLLFVAVACGNTIFGLLNSAALRMLGDMGYSVYLLHGIIMYTTFKFVIGTSSMQTYSPAAHWLTITCVSPIVVLLSYASYRCIELPGMGATAAVYRRLRSVQAERRVAAAA